MTTTEERAAPSNDQPTTYEARDQDGVTLSSGDIIQIHRQWHAAAAHH
jgi:hypothetical protein